MRHGHSASPTGPPASSGEQRNGWRVTGSICSTKQVAASPAHARGPLQLLGAAVLTAMASAGDRPEPAARAARAGPTVRHPVRPAPYGGGVARKGRHRRGGRTTPKGTPSVKGDQHGHRMRIAGPREPDLLAEVAERLRTGEPYDFLSYVSSLVAAVDPRQRDPFARADPGEGPSLDFLVSTFEDIDQHETTALLAAIAQLAPDELVRARCTRVLASRRHHLPPWLARLGQAEVEGATEMAHVLGDGDDVNVGIRLEGGHRITIVVYIDHNLGTVVKDAFMVSRSIDQMAAYMEEHCEDRENTRICAIDPADARVRIKEAVDDGALVYPPFESDTWPACRPIVEWFVRLLPPGGHGYRRPEWSEDERQRLREDFFRSPFGAPLDDRDHRSLLRDIVWFGADYGPGDPVRWSPVSVEILLTDWIPRKIVAKPAYLSKVPDLLRAFVRYCHLQRGIAEHLTAETLESVDCWEGDYQSLIRSPRPQGVEALMAAVGVIDPGGPWTLPGDGAGVDHRGGHFEWGDPDADDFEEGRVAEVIQMLLADAVGGLAELRRLNVRPLPDEPFSWAGIPHEVHGKVEEVLELCDRCCDELLDVEYRTAVRRLLARAAALDPEVFRRRGRSDIAAAALCWAVGKANDLFAPLRPDEQGLRTRAKDLLGFFGLSQGSVSQRATTLLRGADVPMDPWGGWSGDLGSPDLLVSSRRRRIVRQRDEYSPEA